MNEEILVEESQDSSENASSVKCKKQALPPIELLYKQIFDSFDSKIYGFETQIRINDKKLGTLSPDLFEPIAERSNQIVELGKWSFVEMSDMVRRQRAKGRTIPRMFIPVSMKYFCKKYFIDNLMRQLEKAELDPSEVCVMLQAKALAERPAELKEAAALVHEKNVQIAVTGVGSDGLSLSYLDELPIDYLRFDAEFVQQLVGSERAKDIANSFSELATKLGAQLMAEGADDKEQIAALQAIGCSLMQGAFYGDFERESRLF
ncbi:MAG: EAL domain-containing protein [Clostridia bacterium]|nr:EAL domain-containing protein [Clostridia bacterium]